MFTMLLRIFRESQKESVDMFTIMQWATIFHSMFINSVRLIFSMLFPQQLLFFSELQNVSFINYINFQFWNQLCWLVMILHIQTLQSKQTQRKTGRKSINSYSLKEFVTQISSKIRRIESAMAIILLIVILVTNIMTYYTAFAQLFYEWRYKELEDNSGKYEYLYKHDFTPWSISKSLVSGVNFYMVVVRWAVIAVEIILLFVLWRIMRQNLNYYYLKNKKSWIVLTIATWFYFSVSSLFFLLKKFTNIHREEIVFLGNYPTEVTLSTMILLLLSRLFITIPLFFMIFFNIRNIDFAQYLKDTMNGYGIIEYYAHGSIFVKVRQRAQTKGISSEGNWLN